MPYTPVSITGYNANPPEDDGSATQNNEIAWQKHLDKIGAPLKTAIESTQTNVGVSIDAIDVTLAAGLTDISALAKTDGNIIVGNGTTWVAESGATARTSLGVGTGDSPQFTGVNVGHASDTTITRASAGNIAVEGNAVYRAGGTDVPVTDGGTGASTAANARTNLGLGSIATVDSPVPIANGGTASTTAAAARTALGVLSMGTQAHTAVDIDGGTINGITDLAVVDGGTGASTAADARTNLGLGTIATQASSAVSITGGSINGITDLAIADGGTGASTAAGARTGLGLGTIATQNSNAVTISGGSVTGITDLAVADGGTGASTAAGARTNLGLGTIATVDSPVPVANGGTGSTTAANARTALGLGTAAVANTGTSGGTLGFLNGVNTYAGTHTFTNAAWNLITFSASGATNGKNSDAAGVIHSSRTGSGDDNHIVFYNSNGAVGNCSTFANQTNFDTASDERLKTKFAPAGDVGALVDAIRIYDFKWKSNGDPGFGPKAQELHKVLPSAVSVGGDDPKLMPWSWDPSKVVAYLIVELQALRKRVAELEAK